MFKNKSLPIRRHLTLLLLLLLIAPLPAACSTAVPQTPVATLAAPIPTTAALNSIPTESPVAPTTAAYPGPTSEGVTTPTSAAYPLPPSPAPTTDPYPGGLIWIIRPVGVQCEAERPVGYGSLNEAVATLFAAGISVQGSETIELAVTTACGSPTSEHYRVQIGADHLSAVEEMGWVEE